MSALSSNIWAFPPPVVTFPTSDVHKTTPPMEFHSLTHQTLLHVLPPHLPFLDLKRLSRPEEMTQSLGMLIVPRTGVQFPVLKCCGSQQPGTPALGDPTRLLASAFILMYLHTNTFNV